MVKEINQYLNNKFDNSKKEFQVLNCFNYIKTN